MIPARPAISILLPLWVLLASPAGAQTPEPKPVPAPSAQAKVFQSVDFTTACSLAKEQKKLVMVYWWQVENDGCHKLDSITWKDPAVQEWLNSTVVAIAVEGEKDLDLANRFRIDNYPTTSFHTFEGKVLERIPGYYAPDAFLSLSKALLLGRGPDGTYQHPEGAAAEDPLAWLGYANSTFGKKELVDETIAAYSWLLDHAEAKTPGFIDQYIDLILKRLMATSEVNPRVEEYLIRRRDDLRARALAGTATDAEARWVLRYNYWLSQMNKDIEYYLELGGRTERQDQYRKVLFDSVLDDLVAWKKYDEVRAAAGDIVGGMHKRYEEYQNRFKSAVEAGKGSDTAVLAELDGLRQDLEADTSDYYETLLALGSGSDAETLANEYLELFPTGDAYAALMLRAGRLEMKEAAKRLADAGAKAVPDSDPRKVRLPRILKRIEDGVHIGLRETDIQAEIEKGLREQRERANGGDGRDDG
jgi:hypothetical protein